MEDFTGTYNLSKTLRFELRPVGKTLENLTNSGMLEKDLDRAKWYPEVKKILDEEHKKLLERALSSLKGKNEIDWQELADAMEIFPKNKRSKNDKQSLEKVQKRFRERLKKCFKEDEFYEILTEATPDKYFKRICKHAEENGETPTEALRKFKKFSVYFIGYQETRKNIYSAEAQKTAAANRAVNENFPNFLEMVRIFTHIQEKYPAIIENAENEMQVLLRKNISEDLFSRPEKLNDLFQINAYNRFLAQSGIDRLNQIIGGYTREKGIKLRGINEFINLYRQQHPEVKEDHLLAPMPPLYKQILSDRESFSFIPEMFADDQSMLKSVHDFMWRLEHFDLDGNTVDVVEKLKETLNGISAMPDIFVNSAELSKVSKKLCGAWDAINIALQEYKETHYKTKTDREAFIKRNEYSLEELSKLNLERPGNESGGDELKFVKISDAWKGENAKTLFENISRMQAAMEAVLRKESGEPLRERDEDSAVLKEYLDTMQNFLHFIKPLRVEAESGKNRLFYDSFDKCYEELELIVPLYNKVRNYMTQKTAEKEKIKLKFDCPTLANGWDQNKERANAAILLEKEGFFYLGIINPKKKTDFSKLECENGEYQKMVYKYIPDAYKMIPKCSTRLNKVREHFNSSNTDYVLQDSTKFKRPLVITREIFNLSTVSCNGKKKFQQEYKQINGKEYRYALKTWIGFCMDFLKSYRSTSESGFDFSEIDAKVKSEKYENINDFYADVDHAAYRIRFIRISEKDISCLVEDGSLFLFWIYNKDFAPGATGKPNLHTLYWKNLFDLENLKDTILKLNGQAELFWRDRGITEGKVVVHKKGEKLVNRRTSAGKSIPDKLFGEIFHYVNHLQKENLSVEAKELLDSGKVIVKDVKHEIIKDRRFTEPKFFFHVPLTINFKAPDKAGFFNEQVQSFLKGNPAVNIIGLDRGERNLIYLTLIDQNGNILKQKSFNVIEQKRHDGKVLGTDYHEKLDQREKERDEARKNWETIGRIKDLKSGYLSLVVHEIAKMMIEYRAIVVLEDLNFGFKRGRFHIEKQVYQKFEKALIDKLNYLVFKDRAPSEPGGIRKGYQLTDKFQSFEKIGKQSGFLFYVSAGYTSSIDPSTGFANLFRLKNFSNAKTRKSFFSAFDSIRYVEKWNAFVFSFDYKKTDGFAYDKKKWKGNTSWTVYSAGVRLVYDSKTKSEEKVLPTKIILDTLAARGMTRIPDGFDLLAYLKNVDTGKEEGKKFFSNLFFAFDKTLQMRNSCKKTGEDYIESPVLNRNGKFFRSKPGLKDMPENADANGAYHIALKGLYLLQNAIPKAGKGQKVDLKISNEDWFEFIQNRHS